MKVRVYHHLEKEELFFPGNNFMFDKEDLKSFDPLEEYDLICGFLSFWDNDIRKNYELRCIIESLSNNYG